jgi:hypothetical protein
MHYPQVAAPAPNHGPALLAILVGTVFAASGNRVGQQIGIALIGVGATKFVNDAFQSC